MSVNENQTGTLRAEEHGHQPVICIQGNAIDRADTAKCNGKGWAEDKSFTLNTIDRPVVYDARGNGNGSIVPTLTGDHQDRVTDYTALCVGNGQLNQISMSDKANSLDTMHDQQAVMFTSVDCRNGSENPNINGTLQAKSNSGWSANLQNVIREKNHVRRLTPLECERLQGYPDGWTDIPGASDSKRYKALGNSIALPFWEFLAHRFVRMGEVESIGSLFDGIGGFPLVFERAGAETKWTSEIDPFCQEVVRVRFVDGVFYHITSDDL